MASMTSTLSTNIPGAVINAVLISGKLNICHGNAQSLCARKTSKLDEVKLLLENSKIGLACFTEWWLTPKISNNVIAVPGYSIIRNDRLFRRGGGIVLYCNDGFRSSEVYSTNITDASDEMTECLAVELCLDNEKVLIMCVYNPPDNDCSNFLHQKLTDFAVCYENIVLIGDFITDLSRPSRERDQFESTLQSLSLTSIGDEPTFFHRRGCSQLDLLILSDRRKMLRFNQVGFPGLSQHDLIFSSLDFNVIPVTTVQKYRDYINFDPNAIANAIDCIPWNQFYAIGDANELVEFFNEHIIMNIYRFVLRTTEKHQTRGWVQKCASL